MRIRTRYLALIILFIFLPFNSWGWRSSETVRVAVYRGESAVISATGGTANGVRGGQKVAFTADASIDVRKVEKALLVNGVEFSSLEINGNGSGIKINGRAYRGKIEALAEGGGLLLVNELNVEEYLTGLINHEISSQWPMESVKAQAVAARSYLLYQKRAKKNPAYDLESTVYSQVYGGMEREDAQAHSAVMETEGEVLYYNDRIVEALFHSSCGGRTESAGEVWGWEIPYLKSLKDEHCTEAPHYFWEYEISIADFKDRLKRYGGEIGKIDRLIIDGRSESGRIRKLQVVHSGGTVEVSGKELRDALGLDNIRSTNFTVKSREGRLYFAGTGNGHGVGMCQWGAKGMAEAGASYRQILKRYYPGTTIKRYY